MRRGQAIGWPPDPTSCKTCRPQDMLILSEEMVAVSLFHRDPWLLISDTLADGAVCFLHGAPGEGGQLGILGTQLSYGLVS